MSGDRTQRVKERAHRIWEEAGRPHGTDAEHWAQAEREIEAEDAAEEPAPAAAKPKAKRQPKPKTDEAGDLFGKSESAPKKPRKAAVRKSKD